MANFHYYLLQSGITIRSSAAFTYSGDDIVLPAESTQWLQYSWKEHGYVPITNFATTKPNIQAYWQRAEPN